MRNMLDADIGCIADLCHPLLNRLGNRPDEIQARPSYLNVDWGTEAEIQYIADDSTRLKGDLHAWQILAQTRPQCRNVIVGVSLVSGDKINQHKSRMVPRVRREARRIAVIETGIGNDFLEFLFRNGLLNQFLDLTDDRRGLFDPESLRGGDQHGEVACINPREKFRVQPGDQE